LFSICEGSIAISVPDPEKRTLRSLCMCFVKGIIMPAINNALNLSAPNPFKILNLNCPAA
jgi:hypothetical protein